MAAVSWNSPAMTVLGCNHSSRRFSADPRCLKVYNSKEDSILDPVNKPNECSNNGQVWTSKSYHPEMDPSQINPPLVAALKAAAEENVASFHFPGHNRGRAAPSSLTQLIGKRPFLHDLPELDNLFSPEGHNLEAQKQAAELFGASETWFLVGGTTSGILAAIMGTCSPGDTLILPRNAHISATSAMVLSGAVPKYIFPDYDVEWDLPAAVSPSQVEKAIEELEMEGRQPAAVFVTSPTYHGICSNVKEISTLCHLRGIPLIVDEAHGAHFGFHPQLPISALQQGADLVVQSTHKVLCSFTQSSMLHLSGNIVDRERICRCLQTIQSTSPNSLLLASLDAATAQLKEKRGTIFDNAILLAMEAKRETINIPGITVLVSPNFSDYAAIDPLRITIGVYELGLSGFEAHDFLYSDQRVISEIIGSRSISFPFTLGTYSEHVQRLVLGLKHLSSSFFPHRQKKRVAPLKPFDNINMHLTPREAFFSKKKKVDIKDTLGKICGELICPYPPGIPIMIPGEVISERALDILLQVKANGAKISGTSDPNLSTMVICDV